MRKSALYLLLAILLISGWWLLSDYDHISGIIQQYVENGEFVTLEARYAPEQIMENYRDELLVDAHHSFQEPGLKFHPYLLMEVKYALPDRKSKEGVIFWSLVDGEMVLNADSWEKTHGFEDAINANATRVEFKLMNALAKNKGAATMEQLQKELHVEKEMLQPWINSALEKHLIIQKGQELQLHFQDPKILVAPETKISHWLVTKPYNHAQRIPKKYSSNQIQKIAKAAFGEDFTIRSLTEVFLPVYSIEVINPDGSVLTSYWNAVNGQRIQPKYLIQR